MDGSAALQVLAGGIDVTEPDPPSEVPVEEPDLGTEIRRLESEMNRLKEKLRATTAQLRTVERERDLALAQVSDKNVPRPGTPPHHDETGGRIRLSKQLEQLAMALHSASAEAEANDIELRLERRRRLAAKAIADDLIQRLSSASDAAMAVSLEGNEGGDLECDRVDLRPPGKPIRSVDVRRSPRKSGSERRPGRAVRSVNRGVC